MTIKLELTEWEIMVLRAALDKYMRHSNLPKHVKACKVILEKSHGQDDPMAILDELVK